MKKLFKIVYMFFECDVVDYFSRQIINKYVDDLEEGRKWVEETEIGNYKVDS